MINILVPFTISCLAYGLYFTGHQEGAFIIALSMINSTTIMMFFTIERLNKIEGA